MLHQLLLLLLLLLLPVQAPRKLPQLVRQVRGCCNCSRLPLLLRLHWLLLRRLFLLFEKLLLLLWLRLVLLLQAQPQRAEALLEELGRKALVAVQGLLLCAITASAACSARGGVHGDLLGLLRPRRFSTAGGCCGDRGAAAAAAVLLQAVSGKRRQPATCTTSHRRRHAIRQQSG